MFYLIFTDPEKSLVQTTHAFANVLTRGDLSTLSWIASPLTYVNKSTLSLDQTLCTVYYASLNFRDIMLATGKLPPDALPGKTILIKQLIDFFY